MPKGLIRIYGQGDWHYITCSCYVRLLNPSVVMKIVNIPRPRECHSEQSEESAPLQLMNHYYVYIMSNKSRRLYTGITSKLQKRVFEHKNKLLDGFTARYNFDMLVYYEQFSQVASAITREKQIKSWSREKKLRLILVENPDWQDMSLEWEQDPSWAAVPEAEFRPVLKRRSE